MASYNNPIQAYLDSLQAQPAALPRAPAGPLATQNFTPQIDPAELAGMSAVPALGSLNPYARAIIAAAQVMQSTPTAANDQAPTDAWYQKPSGKLGDFATSNAPGVFPLPYNPLKSIQTQPVAVPPTAAQPARADTSTAASGPAAPITPYDHRASTKKRIDPATVDLGQNPRFMTIQYKVPSGRGPLSNNPIYTALNLGGAA